MWIILWLFLLPISISSALEQKNAVLLPHNALAVPLVRQSTSYSCGAAAVLSVLAYWNKYDGDESSLFAPLGTSSENGTDPLSMAVLMRQYELEVDYLVNQTWSDLENAFLRGDTVIVDYQAWHEDDGSKLWDYTNLWEDGHYSVVVAINKNKIFLMDPSVLGGYGYLDREDFLKRWHDYEIRQGQRVEIQQLALYIRGKRGASSFPQSLIYIN
jgi:predicted double-glycine peptidase